MRALRKGAAVGVRLRPPLLAHRAADTVDQVGPVLWPLAHPFTLRPGLTLSPGRDVRGSSQRSTWLGGRGGERAFDLRERVRWLAVHEPTHLTPIVTREQRDVASRLWQLYIHDLSEFRGSMPNDDGLFKAARLSTFFEDPDRCGYLIYSGPALAGIALIRGLSGDQRVMGEFFVVRAARRRRVGYRAAVELLHLHPGRWAIPFQEENPGAARFWRRLATEIAGSECREERRPVPGKPQTPPDSRLFLSV